MTSIKINHDPLLKCNTWPNWNFLIDSFEGLGQLSCQVSHFWICPAFPHEQMFLAQNATRVIMCPSCANILGDTEEPVGRIQYFQSEQLSSFSVTSTCGFQCPKHTLAGINQSFWGWKCNLRILLFFCLKSFIHLCFFFFSKEELCPSFSSSTPLTYLSVYQFRFIFSKFSVYNPSLLLFFLKRSVPIAPPVAKGASSIILLCPLEDLVTLVWKKVLSLAPCVLVWAGLFLVPSDLPPGTPSANTHSRFNGHWVLHLLILCSIWNLLIILALFPQFLLVHSKWPHFLRISGNFDFLRTVVRWRRVRM